MKTFQAVLAAATIGAAAAYTNTTVCPSSEFLKLAPLALNENLEPCQDASGWTMLPPSGIPTAEQRAIMCATPECFSLIDALLLLNPTDCMLVFGEVSLNVKELAETFESSCWSRQ